MEREEEEPAGQAAEEDETRDLSGHRKRRKASVVPEADDSDDDKSRVYVVAEQLSNDCKGAFYRVYAIDLNSTSSSSNYDVVDRRPLNLQNLDPVLVVDTGRILAMGFAVLKSKLYMFGGSNSALTNCDLFSKEEPLFVKDAYLCDLPPPAPANTTPATIHLDDLKKLPPMRTGRYGPCAVVVEGKICVFSGERFGEFVGEKYDRDFVNFEVFTPCDDDPKRGSWSQTPRPPGRACVEGKLDCFVVVRSKLYIWTCVGICLIDVNNLSRGWQFIPAEKAGIPPPRDFFWSERGFFAGNLCFFRPYRAYLATDIETLFRNGQVISVEHAAPDLPPFEGYSCFAPLRSGTFCVASIGGSGLDGGALVAPFILTVHVEEVKENIVGASAHRIKSLAYNLNGIPPEVDSLVVWGCFPV